MSKLEQLINELCPDGVEYKTLGDIGKFTRGNGLQKKDFVEVGKPVIHYGQIYTKYNFSTNITYSFAEEEVYKKLRKAKKNDILIATTSENVKDVAKCVVWLGEEEIGFSGDMYSFSTQENSKYIAYYFQTNYFQRQKELKVTGAKVMRIHSNDMEKFEIPLPPLPVQEEIVRILDSFTELTAELTAELTMRKQQYEYYRENLLNKKLQNNVLLKSVVKKGCSGGTPKKGEEKFYLNGTVPWLRTQDVKFNEIFNIETFITEEAVKQTSAKWIPANCVIVAISGATAGRCAINKIPTTTNQHCYNMEIDETKALYKYIYYCICSQYEELISRKQGARGDLNSSLILGISIPLPSLEEQQRIVDILDRFDTLVNDIKEGLPAEIEARKQQYEYYRDKLLTFKKLEA